MYSGNRPDCKQNLRLPVWKKQQAYRQKRRSTLV